jgi:thioredoxin reductase (NADPH)
MLTTQDLAAVPMFSPEAEPVLRELLRGSGDIQLGSGEFFVHEGDEPMLFAVLSGKLEVIKRVDGIERRIGERLPGTFLGEVPLIYGTPFQAGGRAVEAARVARIDPRQFHAAAVLSPELARRMGELARERVGGLQSIMANARRSKVVIVGERWDPECLALRRFLASNRIIFDAFTPDAPELPGRWVGELPTLLPAVQIADGPTMTQPQLRQLAEALNLDTRAKADTYDTVIVGGGPAGLAAAVYGASEGLKTLVIEREAPGGQAGTSSRIENYLGFPGGISGDELASRALQQAKRLGAEVVITRRIERIDPAVRTIELDGGEQITAKTIILATGVSWRRVAIEGFDRLIGKGIYYGAARSEAATTQGQDIHLIGAGNSAGQAAMFFANHARTVTLLVRGDALEKSMSQYLIEQVRGKANIKVALHSEVQATHGEGHLTAIDVIDRRDGAVRREESAGLFVFIGADAETEWLPAEVVRDTRGYVLTGEELKRAGHWSAERDPYLLETSVPGIFACGDVRLSPVKRVAAAVGEGSMAIAFVHQYLAQLAAAGSRG